MRSANSKSPRHSCDALELIRKLADKKKIEEDSFLLINANEVLARDGIHGKIAEIGVGFGTGRHTNTRRAEYHYKTGINHDAKIMSIIRDPANKERKAAIRRESKPVVHERKSPERPIPGKCSYHGSGSRSHSRAASLSPDVRSPLRSPPPR